MRKQGVEDEEIDLGRSVEDEGDRKRRRRKKKENKEVFVKYGLMR